MGEDVNCHRCQISVILTKYLSSNQFDRAGAIESLDSFDRGQPILPPGTMPPPNPRNPPNPNSKPTKPKVTSFSIPTPPSPECPRSPGTTNSATAPPWNGYSTSTKIPSYRYRSKPGLTKPKMSLLASRAFGKLASRSKQNTF